MAITKERAQALIKDIGFDSIHTLGVNNEVNLLKDILYDDERILHLATGTYSNSKNLIVATDDRMLIIKKPLLNKPVIIDIPFDSIDRAFYKLGIILANFTLNSDLGTYFIDNLEKADAMKFTNIIADFLECDEEQEEDDDSTNSGSDVIEKLERLASLKDKGALTEAEFEIQKKKLLK